MRTALIEMREAQGLTQGQMAQKCQCSLRQIIGVEEDDWTTHPEIAAQMAVAYGFGLDVYNEIVYQTRRAEVLPKPSPPAGGADWARFCRRMKRGSNK